MRAWAVRVVQVGVQVRLGGGNRRFRPAHHPRHKLNHHHHLCSCVQTWCVCVVCVCGEWGGYQGEHGLVRGEERVDRLLVLVQPDRKVCDLLPHERL